MKCVVLMALATFTLLQPGAAEPEIHLIPAGDAGQVTIVFRVTRGELPAREGAARLYRIPENGILLTAAEPNVGMSPAWRFFSVAADGTRNPIPLIQTSSVRDTPENRADDAIRIFYPRRGRTQVGGAGCTVEYDQYLVGTTAQLLASDEARDRRRLTELLEQAHICP